MLVALLEEYKKATIPYKEILQSVSLSNFNTIFDAKTEDADCKSIQTITFHIIHSGHTYANYINTISTKKWYEYDSLVDCPKKGIIEIDKMLVYTESSFKEIWNKTNEEIDTWKFETRWNVTYNFEQLMEHAIVHILRHRRQVELFLKM